MNKADGGLQDIHMLLDRASRNLQQAGHCADGNPRIILDQRQDPIARLYRPFGVLKALRRFTAVLEPDAEIAILQINLRPEDQTGEEILKISLDSMFIEHYLCWWIFSGIFIDFIPVF